MDNLFVCLGVLLFVAPVALLIVALVEVHKLKSAMRHLVRRVGELETRSGPMAAAPARPTTREATPFARAAAPPPPPPSTIPAPAVSATPLAQTPPPPPTPPPIPPPVRPPPPPAPAPAPAKPIDWEAFLGVKLFAWIGGFVLFLGIVFLVK